MFDREDKTGYSNLGFDLGSRFGGVANKKDVGKAPRERFEDQHRKLEESERKVNSDQTSSIPTITYSRQPSKSLPRINPQFKEVIIEPKPTSPQSIKNIFVDDSAMLDIGYELPRLKTSSMSSISLYDVPVYRTSDDEDLFMGLSGPETKLPTTETTRTYLSIVKDMIIGNAIGITIGHVENIDDLTKSEIPDRQSMTTYMDLVKVLLQNLKQDRGVFKLYNVVKNYSEYVKKVGYVNKDACNTVIHTTTEYFIKEYNRRKHGDRQLYIAKSENEAYGQLNNKHSYTVVGLDSESNIETNSFYLEKKDNPTSKKSGKYNLIAIDSLDQTNYENNELFVLVPKKTPYFWSQTLVCKHLVELDQIVKDNPSISTYDAASILISIDDRAYNDSLNRSVVLAVNGSIWAMLHPSKMGQIFREVYISASTDTLITTRSQVSQDVSGILALIMMMASTRSIESEQGTFKRVRTIIDYVRKYYARTIECQIVMKRILNGNRPIGTNPNLALYTLEKCLFELLAFTDNYTHNPSLGLLKVQDMLVTTMRLVYKHNDYKANTINMAVMMSLLCAFYTTNQKSILPGAWRNETMKSVQTITLVDYESLVDLLHENITGSKTKSRVQRELYGYCVDRSRRTLEPQKRYRMARDGYTKLPF
jgi:hypothetical protein